MSDPVSTLTQRMQNLITYVDAEVGKIKSELSSLPTSSSTSGSEPIELHNQFEDPQLCSIKKVIPNFVLSRQGEKYLALCVDMGTYRRLLTDKERKMARKLGFLIYENPDHICIFMTKDGQYPKILNNTLTLHRNSPKFIRKKVEELKSTFTPPSTETVQKEEKAMNPEQ